MTDRVILAVKFTPAGPPGLVRKAVSGFLRYVQHRDVHPAAPQTGARPDVSRLLKYVAYRDQASRRAELFGPHGPLTSDDRKAFAGFVASALDNSAAQLFRDRDGELRDRRRAVYRFVISPERAHGLDLSTLTRTAMTRLEVAIGVNDLRWIAAIHRNTRHNHVHLVVAGMHRDARGAFHRVDVTRTRLAAMKEVLALEIERQRGGRTSSRPVPTVVAEATDSLAHMDRAADPPRQICLLRLGSARSARQRRSATVRAASLIALQAVARRYQQRMQRELADSLRERECERVA